MAPLRDLPLEEGRRRLLRWIDLSRPQGSLKNQVIVVFDGHPDHFGNSNQNDIRVIFSDGCSADDKIKRMVEEDSDQKNCVVVSDDKDIFLYARSLGARIMSVSTFTTAKIQHSHGRQETGGKYISLSRQESINQELGEIWLKEKK